MRIDKFLWCVRVFKTRSIAAEEIKKNRISVHGNTVKSSREVQPGDLVKIRKNQIDYQIKILELPKSRVGAKLVPQYIEDRTQPEQYELLKQRQAAQEFYRGKGEGRPTKKDRRAMDGYLEGEGDSTDWNLFFSEEVEE